MIWQRPAIVQGSQELSTLKLDRTNIEKVAQAMEAGARHAVPGLREALAEAKAGTFATVHTPEQIAARKCGCPAGTMKAGAAVAIERQLQRSYKSCV